MSGFTDPLILLGILALLVVISEWLVAHTSLRHLGTALLVIVLAALVANLGIIPAASSAPPLYDGIFAFLAPVAIFFLLLEVNLRDLKRAGLPMVLYLLLRGSRYRRRRPWSPVWSLVLKVPSAISITRSMVCLPVPLSVAASTLMRLR